MVDSRAGRVLDPGERSMVDEDEWEWIEEHATRRLRPPADRDLAAAAAGARACTTSRRGTRRCATAPGARSAAHLGEKLRQGARPRALGGVRRVARAHDGRSSSAVGTGERGEPPATIVALSGDVHHAYLAEVGFPPGTGMRSTRLAGDVLAVPQPARRQGAHGHALHGLARRRACSCARWRARRASRTPSVRWRYAHDEPWFDNQVATLELDGRQRAASCSRRRVRARGRASIRR